MPQSYLVTYAHSTNLSVFSGTHAQLVATMLQLKLPKVEHADATDIDSGRLSAASVALTSEMVFAFFVPAVAVPELLQTLYYIVKKTTMISYVHTLVI